ncbi:MAG: integrase core domain-containing protein [Bacteroidales bacterium]|nr:integrase core domain-containing protein [Bacteroidales bacterium]
MIYINPTDSVTELRTLISDFIEYYNTQRPHQSLGGIAPTKIYFSLAA